MSENQPDISGPLTVQNFPPAKLVSLGAEGRKVLQARINEAVQAEGASKELRLLHRSLLAIKDLESGYGW